MLHVFVKVSAAIAPFGIRTYLKLVLNILLALCHAIAGSTTLFVYYIIYS